jgi:PAS domain S-box-containing protein
MPDVMWSISYPDFTPLYISKSAIELYGYPAERFMTDPMLWSKITHPDDKNIVDKALLDIKKHGKSTRENRILCPDGNEKIIVDRSWVIYEKDKPVRVDGITKDITAAKRAEQALIESKEQLKELNATKDKFFSIIAHDLKSPFNSMLGFSEILTENFDKYDSHKQKQFIGFINQELQGTYKLLENLLYWSRSQRGTIEFNPELINVNGLVNETIGLLRLSSQNKFIQLTNEVPLDINVTADRDMLLTIFRNSISNAIKFTPKNGEIRVNGKKDVDNQFIEISVSDNGVGIAKERQSSLFDIGENKSTKGTENENGTGLGLILCKEFVEKHNGHIEVESEVGVGTKFIFSIPV